MATEIAVLMGNKRASWGTMIFVAPKIAASGNATLRNHSPFVRRRHPQESLPLPLGFTTASSYKQPTAISQSPKTQ